MFTGVQFTGRNVAPSKPSTNGVDAALAITVM